ncbi:MAG: DUF6449 domain-containing protein [Lachnospiraceae bacterium]|nr:DUF6449 domain-containing protein [Lachnospiraceae bacterium]
MTSKSLYFKLVREDLKRRLWAAALIGLGCFFMFPVVAAFLAGEIRDFASYEKGLEAYTRDMSAWLSFDNAFMTFCMIVAALICGLSSFSYLNAKNKVDFYHSIPVIREKLYAVNYLNGILILAVPYAVSIFAAAVIGISNGMEAAKLWPLVLDSFVLNLIYFVLNYTVVVIASMMTGHLVIGFLGSNVFAFLIPSMAGILQAYFQVFFITYVDHSETLMMRLMHVSPVVEYIYQVAAYAEHQNVWPAALAAALVAVLLAVAGCLLYRKRPSEAAGKAMAFGVSRVIVRIPIVISSALGLGLFFWGMRQNMSWSVFGVICGAVISHCVIEIIYHFDFKKLFSHKLQLLGCTLVSMAVLFTFRYDLTGYERYLPDAESVREAAVCAYSFNNWTSYGQVRQLDDGSYTWDWKNANDYIFEHMHYGDTENLRSIAAVGVDQTAEARRARFARTEPEREMAEKVTADDSENLNTPESEVTTSITIRYTLRSGRHVYRGYNVSLKDIMPQIEKLYQDEQYQKGAFPLMERTVEEIGTIRYKEESRSVGLNQMTVSEKQELLDAYRMEFASLTMEQMKTEYPIGLIRFTRTEDEKAIEWERLQWEWRERNGQVYSRSYDDGNFAAYDYYPVYPSFAQTIRLLEKQGLRPGSCLGDLDIQSIKMICYSNTKEEAVSVMITDPEEIRELKPLLVLGRRGYYNDFCQMDKIYGEIVMTEDGESSIENVNFVRGTVPEFVKERLREAMK